MNRLAVLFAIVAVFAALCYVNAYYPEGDCYSLEKEVHAIEKCSDKLNTTNGTIVSHIATIALNQLMLIADLTKREDAEIGSVCMASALGFPLYTEPVFEKAREFPNKSAFIEHLKGDHKDFSDCLHTFFELCGNDAAAECAFGAPKVEKFKKCCPRPQ